MSQVSNKDIKKEYSWLPKGVTSAIINQIHSGSKSLITAFWSDGEFLWAMLDKTVKSDWFQWFLCILKYFLKLRKLDMYGDSVIMLDNASYHTAFDTQDIMKKLGMKVCFLPPYSPVLAPVEQFFKLSKARIKSTRVDSTTNFSSIAGAKAIINACDSISLDSRQKVWSDFIINMIGLIVE